MNVPSNPSEHVPSGTPGLSAYRLAIRRPVTVAMLFLTLLVFGWRSYRELPLNLMPDIAYPTLTVRTEFEGSAPEDVEKLLTRPLEERLTIVSGVRQVSSISSAELSEIILEFAWGTDMNVALQDVRESLDLFDQPLAVSRKPVILRYDPTLDPVMRIALTAGTPGETLDRDTLRVRLTAIREAAEEQVKSDLEAETGIAQVSIEGGREREIQIRVDSERLKALGLTLSAVVTALEQQNINLSGGTLREGKAEYYVRTLNEFQDIDEIRATIVGIGMSPGATASHADAGASEGARPFRLDDLAHIEFGEKEPETIIRINGEEAVELKFYKEGDANVVEVCDTLRAFFYGSEPSIFERAMVFFAEYVPLPRVQEMRERLERRKRLRDKLASRLPDYTVATLITDQSRFISAAIREVQRTALLGGLLALAMLFVFLREFRSTVIVGVAIPISVIATFVPMFAGGISLNIMSLGGLALGIGMLVDNSIVVLESIFRCREEGDDLLAAADRGTKEVAGAVTASTLTTIAVFFPLVFVEGIAGQLFRDLALTVTFSLLASLLVALYLIPMIASRKPATFARSDGVVWFLRSYRNSRDTDGRSASGALARIPVTGLRYARDWIRKTWGETVE
ncbi:MAG: efflux RND transporter permease subunit, partial [Candidatus Hydrogenedentes bacterium]|nr:efflux RND transporter permease subunit [Candidatus Hydrogenedentota bacterium]